jgi:hypothetical protein
MSSDMRHEKTIVFEEPEALRLDGVIRSGLGEDLQALRPDQAAGHEMAGIRECLEYSAVCTSIPTPFGGRRDASSGRGWADYRAWETGFDAVALTLCDGSPGKTGNPSLSQPGGAHAAGGRSPPRASIKNRNCILKPVFSLKFPKASINNRWACGAGISVQDISGGFSS